MFCACTNRWYDICTYLILITYRCSPDLLEDFYHKLIASTFNLLIERHVIINLNMWFGIKSRCLLINNYTLSIKIKIF